MSQPAASRPEPPGHPQPRTRRWLGLLALGIGLVLVVGFGMRAMHQIEFAKRVESGEIQVQTLRGWMTLPYIEHTYGVPQAELRAALKLPETGYEEHSLRWCFMATGMDPATGRQAIEALILSHRDSRTETKP